MDCPITFQETFKQRIISTNSKFILIGNAIDGFLDFRFYEFKNFEEVKKKLFNILSNIHCSGEWVIDLYQVKENYKIKTKYGYFKTPKIGKHIYKYSYMRGPVKQINFTDNSITIFCTTMDYWEDWSAEEDGFHNYELFIEIDNIRIK